ncbi:MAG: retropepsin-like aspartic protease [Nitrospirota bacterium]
MRCTGGATGGLLSRFSDDQRRPLRLFSAAWGLFGVLFCTSDLPVALAAVYLCVDAAGQQVLTDRPGQLSGCEAMPVDPALHAGPSALATPPPSSVPRTVIPNDVGSVTEATTALETTGRVITIPVEHMGAVLIVATQLNRSRPARLILDTGASYTILSRAVALDLGLFSDAHTATVTLNTVGGPVQADVVRVESIRVAEAEVRNSLAAIYDLPDAPEGVEGLLGLSFLRQFEVTLDAVQGQLRLGARRQGVTPRINEGREEIGP